MVSEPKKRPRKAKRRRKAPEETIDYVVEIEGWDFSYWLALNTVRDALDPYHEHRDVEMKGGCYGPPACQPIRSRYRFSRRRTCLRTDGPETDRGRLDRILP